MLLPEVVLRRGQLKQVANLQKTALKVLICMPVLTTYLTTDPILAMSTELLRTFHNEDISRFVVCST
jgi:hypothetical protein